MMAPCALLLALLACVHCADSLDSSIFRDLHEVGAVSLDHTFVLGRRPRSALQPDMEDTLLTSVKAGAAAVTLTFTPAVRHHADIPVYGSMRGRLEVHTADTRDKCTSIYTDTESMATALVDTCTGGQMRMLAELIINGSRHVILPTNPRDVGLSPAHRLYRLTGPTDLLHDYVDKGDWAGPAGDSSRHRARPRQRRGTRQTYTIELLIVVDYSLYNTWYGYSAGAGAAGREAATMQRVTAMYAFAAAAINTRYQNMETSAPDIRVELVALYIAKSSGETPFTEPPYVDTTNVRGLIDMRSTLVRFETWIGQMKAAGLTDHDHALLFSSRDFKLDGLAGAAGLANKGAMCTTASQSMVEDHFNFLSLTIATHELGHGINASHDSDGNGCRGDQGYIMTAANSPMRGSSAHNPWMFSSCSQEAFSGFLATADVSCLLERVGGAGQGTTGPLPGQLYSPDVQCQNARGPTGSVCKSLHTGNWEAICTAMWCNDGNLDHCTLIIPAEGTTCGDQKWCIYGECVTSASAPAADESCLFGDQLGNISPGLSCSDVVSQSLYQCYNTDLYSACCTSCSAGRLPTSGCEYGDRSDCSAIHSHQCYDVTLGSSACCQTCAGAAVAGLPDDCRYGDRASQGCSTDVCAVPAYAATCCATCAGAASSTSTSSTATSTTATTTKTTQSTTTATTPSRRTTRATGGTTTDGHQTTGTAADDDELADWMVPVAAGGGGALLLLLLLAVVFCGLQQRRAQRSKHTSRGRQRSKHDKQSKHDRRRLRDEQRNNSYENYNSEKYNGGFQPTAADYYGLRY